MNGGRVHTTKLSQLNDPASRLSKYNLQWVARVLLDTKNGELDCDVERRVCDVGLLVTKTHGPDEAYNCQSLLHQPCLGVQTHVRI